MHVLLRRIISENKKFVRCKHKANHWSVLRKKVHPVDKAWKHFDDFYKDVFASEWESIKNGLRGKPKYMAVVNSYGNTVETISRLENAGALNIRTLFNLEKQYAKEKFEKGKRQAQLETVWNMDKEMDERNKNLDNSQNVNNIEKCDRINEEDSNEKQSYFSLESKLQKAKLDSSRIIDTRNILSTSVLQEFVPATKIKGREDFILESDHYKYYSNSDCPIQIEKQYDFYFPENLNIYSFEKSNHSDYRPARRDITGVFNYYLMDGGSVLPILALDIRPGHKILDMCAAPGGKSMLALQTLYPDCVIANDNSAKRVNRIYKVLREYFYDLDERFIGTGKISVTCKDGRDFVPDDYDRILVDVPCTTDRLSVRDNEDNIFKPTRIKERLQLPEIQSELLYTALKCVKPGGIVVYSTCSLSPIQNDGVVQMALSKINEGTRIKLVIQDMTEALKQTEVMYKFANPKLMKYGHLIVPYLPLNFGPTYFCKIKRIK